MPDQPLNAQSVRRPIAEATPSNMDVLASRLASQMTASAKAALGASLGVQDAKARASRSHRMAINASLESRPA